MSDTGALEQFIRDELAADSSLRIAPDLDLLQRGIIDSLGLMQLISFIEERFGIAVTDDELVADNFRTIRDIQKLVERKGGMARAGSNDRAQPPSSHPPERALRGRRRLLSPLRRRRRNGGAGG